MRLRLQRPQQHRLLLLVHDARPLPLQLHLLACRGLLLCQLLQEQQLRC
jgi:hypothetical protein